MNRISLLKTRTLKNNGARLCLAPILFLASVVVCAEEVEFDVPEANAHETPEIPAIDVSSETPALERGQNELWRYKATEIWADVRERNRVDLPAECKTEYGGRWIDRTQRVISAGACAPAVWFDRFFGNKRDEDFVPGTTLRVVTGWDWNSDRDGEFSGRYRLKAHLPNAAQRLRLIVTNRDVSEEDGLPLEEARTSDELDLDGGARAALSWAIAQSRKYNFDFDVGLNSDVKTNVSVRYRFRHRLNEKNTFRYTHSAFWEDTSGTGTTALFEFDRQISNNLLFRFSERLRFTEEDKELGRIFWLDGISLGQRIDNKRALVYSVGRSGVVDPEYRVDNYRSSIRYRQNIFRPWLFYELERYVEWPERLGYRDVQGVAFRLETYFGIID